VPTLRGESMVIRILPTKSMRNSLESLGLDASNATTFRQLIAHPHGIICVTGPTGSGKTTTLYACLHELNQDQHKIITIEDPIEYEMEGITQIQVNPKLNLFRDKLIKTIDETTKDKTLFQDYQQTIKILNKKILDMFIESKNLMKVFYIFVDEPNISLLEFVDLKKRTTKFLIMRDLLKDLCYSLPVAVVLLNTCSVYSVYYPSEIVLDESYCIQKPHYPPFKLKLNKYE
jgi:energy-coupling factor transporter ATP-binding protein EcfA2